MREDGEENGASNALFHSSSAAPAYNSMPLRPGTRLDDRYTIESVIAAGGFGITYLARHDGLGRTYAVKEHFPRQFAYRDEATSEVRPTDPQIFEWALDRFLREGRALAKCKHTNVVDVTDVFEDNGTAYMVLVYEVGQSLANWLNALGRPPTQNEIDGPLNALLDALAFVHAQGLLHRDIAPDNIIIRTDGTPCLIDFGAARQAIAERSQLMPAIVKSGYSPPEQYATTGKAQGPWSDIYALGATLYQVVTGRSPPESTERISEDELQSTTEAVSSPEQYRPGFLAGIDAALRIRVAERPQSVAAWRTILSSEAVGGVDQASLPGVGAGASTSGRRPMVWALVLGAGAVALAAALMFPDWWSSQLRWTGSALQSFYSGRQPASPAAGGAKDRAREEQVRQAAVQEEVRLEQVRQDDAAFSSALRLREPAGFRLYLDQYPTGRHREAALAQLAALELEARNNAEAGAWERARVANTLGEYKDYLKLWPSGSHADEARRAVDRLEELWARWGAMKQGKSPELLRRLLADAKGTEYEGMIETRLNEVERADKADWAKAELAGSKIAYSTYLAEWNEGDYADEAKARIVAIDASAQEWSRIKGKDDEAALEAFLRRDYISDFESAALAELVALKRARDKSLPGGISLLAADAMAALINGKTIRFLHDGTAITFNRATAPSERLTLHRSYLQTTTKQKFSLEGPFAAEIVFDGRRLSIGGVGGVQESRVDKTGSLLLLQVLSSDRSEHDVHTKDRLYATLQIIKHGQRYVCIGTQWSFMLGHDPKQFNERCQID
jgi:serine/threonine protein kinase